MASILRRLEGGDLAETDASPRPQVVDILEKLSRTASPAMKCLRRRLLEQLKPQR